MKVLSLIAAAVLLTLSAADAADPAGPAVFSPETNSYARQLMNGSFEIVDTLKKMDPKALAAFRARVPASAVADKGEKFEIGCVISDPALPRGALVFAGGNAKLSFVVHITGSIAVFHMLTILAPGPNDTWQTVAVAQGNIEKGDFDSLKAALRKGRFIEQPLHPPSP